MSAFFASITCYFKALLCLGFFLAYGLSMPGQNKSYADSLELVHKEGSFEERNHLYILDELSKEHPDPDKALNFSNELIFRARTRLD